MIQFHQQNKNKANQEGQNQNKSEEKDQLTEIKTYKSQNFEKSGHVSIRNDLEEEKKMTENNLNDPIRTANITQNIERNETKYDSIIVLWEKHKKNFRFQNIFSIIQYLNLKINTSSEKEISKNVNKIKVFILFLLDSKSHWSTWSCWNYFQERAPCWRNYH